MKSGKNRFPKRLRKKAKAFRKHPIDTIAHSRYGWLAALAPIAWENREAILDFIGEATGRIQAAAERARNRRAARDAGSSSEKQSSSLRRAA